jgi:L,D-peptidoglycan transpeptidase YkuD (ErfK/YbiS/YcfS/YnhG family)
MTPRTVRRPVALAVASLVGVLLVAGPAVAGPVVAGPADAGTFKLDGVRVALPAGTTQVITVNHTRKWHARVVLWERSTTGWHAIARTTNGRTGYGGLVPGSRRRQGSGRTPLGTYRLLSAFGTHDDTTRLPYTRIKKGDYWVEDNASAYYNRYRNKAQGGFRWWLTRGVDTSEELTDYPTQYEYAINTGFNYGQVRHRGAGIFLHVNGRGATGSCVSAPRSFLQTAMARLDPKRGPVIAIGR